MVSALGGKIICQIKKEKQDIIRNLLMTNFVPIIEKIKNGINTIGDGSESREKAEMAGRAPCLH